MIFLVVFRVSLGVFQSIYRFCNAVAACIGIMRSLAIVGTEKCAVIKTFGLGFIACQNCAGNVVYIRFIYNVKDVERTADMGINRIPFSCPVYIICLLYTSFPMQYMMNDVDRAHTRSPGVKVAAVLTAGPGQI